jgi:hypothetical protein
VNRDDVSWAKAVGRTHGRRRVEDNGNEKRGQRGPCFLHETLLFFPAALRLLKRGPERVI